MRCNLQNIFFEHISECSDKKYNGGRHRTIQRGDAHMLSQEEPQVWRRDASHRKGVWRKALDNLFRCLEHVIANQLK